MREAEFRDWMERQGNAPKTISTRISDARRVERHYGDLDAAFDADRFESILRELNYTAADKAAGKPNPSRLEIDGDLQSSLASYKGALSIYTQFRADPLEQPSANSQADRIRNYVVQSFVEPARRQRLAEFSVRAGDIHQAMGLENAMPAVCSVLDGQKLTSAAGLSIIRREGPPQGPNVVVTYKFDDASAFGVAFAESALRKRFGEPTAESVKMVSFALPDGRAIALQKDVKQVQLWFEDADAASPPPAQATQHYAATQGRHSNLPARLRHAPDAEHQALGFPKPVISVRAANAEELNAILNWYDSTSSGFNRAALERFRAVFLARYPDFEPDAFRARSGGYFEAEREYKERLLERAQQALTEDLNDEQLGGRLLDLLTSSESGLLGWRTDGRIKNLRSAHPGLFERSAGKLARDNGDVAQAIARFVLDTWEALAADQTKSAPYSESRNIPSMIAAFARPQDAYGINTEPVQRVHKALFSQPVFGYQPLTPAEYERVLGMAHQLHDIMRDEWGWAPRDLWDVQGFIWAVSHNDVAPAESDASASEGTDQVPPTNLILYGPPGTGKTYATAYEAVRLCDGQVSKDRDELKQRYDALVDAGQIAFVTFHQSYAYEDFVEGLRPTTSSSEGEESASAGFRLEPRRGVFREIAALAEHARTAANHAGGFELGTRDVFKMSLGRAGVEDYIYDAAIDGNYVVLGWGGEVDWADPAYESYDAVFYKWNELQPGTSGNSGNIAQVWRFRTMKEGDLVIVSEGNSQFRAIGEITGPYRYDPTGVGTYNHRRAVRWLLVLDDPLPVDTIYDGPFTMASCYRLKPSKIKREALARLLPGAETAKGAAPDQFVLIIDEINRANISKVFGELITLLEPDKRLGERNALRVKLPYSGESFGVPNNLHIIGTMNTADRSIALLDTALRRRFDFRELMPNHGVLAEEVGGVPLRNMLRTINDRIEYLFDREHQIGHAYFIHCATKKQIDSTMRDKVIPLLQEYFYEDWGKVAAVLGDDTGEGRFLVRKSLVLPAIASQDGATDERFRWSVKPEFDLIAYDQFR